MDTVTLGRTGIEAPKNGFGALPVQRVGMTEAVALLQAAYEGGIRFFDTARAYTDSEEKLGTALSGVRKEIFIASKAPRFTVDEFWEDLETSLKKLKTDYIDVYQFHNPSFCPKPGDGTGLYEAMSWAKETGVIRHIGLTNHRLNVAREAVLSGLYETVQYPFSYLATLPEIELTRLCKSENVGFIAMKALAGGTITNSRAAYAWLAKFDNVLPIWGIQRMSELEEFLSYQTNPPALTEELSALIKKDKKELSGSFCRGCGYCMPCPVGIQINNCARTSLMVRRAPTTYWFGPEWQAEMEKIRSCLHCNQCAKKCPYGLNTPKLLEENLADYENLLRERNV